MSHRIGDTYSFFIEKYTFFLIANYLCKTFFPDLPKSHSTSVIHKQTDRRTP